MGQVISCVEVTFISYPIVRGQLYAVA